MAERWTKDSLLAFEEEIAAEFAAGRIQSPIHLGGGNEDLLIPIFNYIKPWDWIFCAWRSHYHCLLKGVPRDQVKAAIMKGHSVSLCFPDHKIISSGIVGGIAPIAMGLAWALKQREVDNHNHFTTVHCFIGDMTAESGIVHESMKYAARHRLPLHWIIEDNHTSVCTDTQASWGLMGGKPDITRYYYNLSRPHSGIGKWVRF